MSKRQSKPCRFGAACHAKKCAFKHPEIKRTSNAPNIYFMSLDDQKEADRAIMALIAEAEHSIFLNQMISSIVYTRYIPSKPYEIEGRGDLGTFKTWDKAYDSLLQNKYSAPKEVTI